MNSAPIKRLISTSDLGKIDVRIGTISRCRGRGVFGDARNAACRRPDGGNELRGHGVMEEFRHRVHE